MIDNRLFEKYDGLIFDMDGTLIDTMPVHARAWNMVGEQFGYRFNSQIMYDLGGATVSTIASAIMQDAGMPQERLNEVIQAKRLKWCVITINKNQLRLAQVQTAKSLIC